MHQHGERKAADDDKVKIGQPSNMANPHIDAVADLESLGRVRTTLRATWQRQRPSLRRFPRSAAVREQPCPLQSFVSCLPTKLLRERDWSQPEIIHYLLDYRANESPRSDCQNVDCRPPEQQPQMLVAEDAQFSSKQSLLPCYIKRRDQVNSTLLEGLTTYDHNTGDPRSQARPLASSMQEADHAQ
ncbi:uncharacterized protein B0I36DRAFT_369673 [Microdochium trichocladiopsis]|uniref:Uncharacterized protein n=1 Tax=Microdochium trichocladiopsis TaxID=1682393 RepID=A0A9P8XR17_9PEZI|nr:uncharacterized protein B0I36DRAFT_369673 [Microdochium trichocladiopsis]KAH7012526.1 hypothetical protein B0I36DRAFT_369673 [Microdochium trichocladiopsis]